MPRKPARQSRPVNARRALPVYRQCIACGYAQVDPMYGLGKDSWCPECKRTGNVLHCEGQLPDPELYGFWVIEKKKQGIPVSVVSPISPTTGVNPVKTRKTHTGAYSCLECMVEYDLVADESLKCDGCGGMLEKGTLEELDDGDDDEDEG